MNLDYEFAVVQYKLNRKIGQMVRRAHEAIHENAESAQRILSSPLPINTMIYWLRKGRNSDFMSGYHK